MLRVLLVLFSLASGVVEKLLASSIIEKTGKVLVACCLRVPSRRQTIAVRAVSGASEEKHEVEAEFFQTVRRGEVERPASVFMDFERRRDGADASGV